MRIIKQLKFNKFLVEYLKTHKWDYEKLVRQAMVEYTTHEAINDRAIYANHSISLNH